MNDYLDVGVFDDKGKLLYLEKQKAKSGQNVFHVEVSRQPAKAGVDPLNKLIDKVSDDNVVRATETK
jgi:ABC-2 type transport system permease protein